MLGKGNFFKYEFWTELIAYEGPACLSINSTHNLHTWLICTMQ